MARRFGAWYGIPSSCMLFGTKFWEFFVLGEKRKMWGIWCERIDWEGIGVHVGVVEVEKDCGISVFIW